MTDSGRDEIYRNPLANVGDFQFDAAVASVFDDMIRRSVPGYGSIIAMLPTLAKRFVGEGTRLYDLGCSLGTAIFSVADHVPPGTEVIAIDQSEPMIKRFRDSWAERYAVHPAPVQLTDQIANILEVDLENAGLTLINFTLQFIAKEERLGLLTKVAAGTVPGGAVLISEKIHVEDVDEQSLQVELHHDFKRAHGYSNLEIAQKRSALENTLLTETVQTHRERLFAAGFDHVLLWFACLGFVSMIGVKSGTKS